MAKQTNTQKYWLMKSEPETYPIDQLKKDQKTWWTGVRNYQARNFMMKDMQIGDEVLFYHSNAEPPGIVGIAKVCALAQPDESQFDKKSEQFEPRATREKPVWFCVQIEFVKKFSKIISLTELKNNKSLQEMPLLQKGQRLSVQPVNAKQFESILKVSK